MEAAGSSGTIVPINVRRSVPSVKTLILLLAVITRAIAL